MSVATEGSIDTGRTAENLPVAPPAAARTPRSGSPRLLDDLRQAVVGRLGPVAETAAIERVVIGVFFTGVKLTNGAGGLCATPVKNVPQAVCCPTSAAAMPAPGRIAGTPALKAMEGLDGPPGLGRAVAIATLNALAETLWRSGGPPDGAEAREGDAFDALALAPGKRVALVGAFPPYIKALRKLGQPFQILELDPATLRPDEMPFYVPAERAPEVVPAADVVVATGTTLANDSLDDLLRLLRPGAEAAVIGPTTTLAVEPYRARGVTVIGGTRVHEPDVALGLLAEGGSGYHVFGRSVERVTLRWKPA